MPEKFNNTRPKPFSELEERNPSFVKRNINEPLDDFVSVFRNRYNDSYVSGIGELPLPETYDFVGSGNTDMTRRSVRYYEKTMRDIAFSLPHSAKWAVFIRYHNRDYLLDEISKLGIYEPTNNKSDDWDFSEKSDRLTSEDAHEKIGCIFALGVSQTGHTLSTTNAGGSNGSINGFIKTPITQGRADNTPLDIIVKETNSSYTDFVLRPWSILASHKGLHARPKNQSIKADITIFEMDYTRQREQPMIRKVFNYFDCVPTVINTENLDYDTDRLMQRQIQFVYNYYTIQGGDVFNPTQPVPEEFPYETQPIIPQIIPEK